MSDSCSVLIAAPDLLPLLKERTEHDGELLAFTDAEALRALEVIMKRRPSIVMLERLFAASPRGAALIHRIKADPSLKHCEIRVTSHETGHTRVSPRRPADQAATTTVAAVATASPVQPLDRRGTRRAPRFKMSAALGVLVDGNQASLVDLSTAGAQVLSPGVLKPNQRIRMTLYDDQGTLRFNAVVAWAAFEPAKSGARYRAGIEFLDAAKEAVDAYCRRHKKP